jgi:hypothetical protein
MFTGLGDITVSWYAPGEIFVRFVQFEGPASGEIGGSNLGASRFKIGVDSLG